MHDILIRLATKADAPELLAIYKPYVIETAISFEYEVPCIQEFEKRIEKILLKYPFLVALAEQRIVGYAYAAAFKERVAYDWTVETTVYIRQDYRGQGIGKKLYIALEESLKKQNILNLTACIAFSSIKDEHLDNSSVRFHEQLGYKKVGHFTKCGHKFCKWYDVVWMEKLIGEHSAKPKSVVPITNLPL